MEEILKKYAKQLNLSEQEVESLILQILPSKDVENEFVNLFGFENVEDISFIIQFYNSDLSKNKQISNNTGKPIGNFKKGHSNTESKKSDKLNDKFYKSKNDNLNIIKKVSDCNEEINNSNEEIKNNSYIRKMTEDKNRSTKTFINKNYIEIKIPAKSRKTNHTEIPITVLPSEHQKHFSYKKFNAVQSKVFQTVYQSTKNFLVSAPTGSGKTDIAFLTILKSLQKPGKIIYIVPMKALAHEIATKLSKRLDVTVLEYTGDVDSAYTEIANAKILVATPEKFDILTRRQNFSFLVDLLIVDEIHLLHERRGAVVEAVICRMFRFVEIFQSPIRIVGLSATMPNYSDVGKFIRAEEVFHFDDGYRPVPLEVNLIGIRQHDEDNDFNFDVNIEENLNDLLNNNLNIDSFCNRDDINSCSNFLSSDNTNGNANTNTSENANGSDTINERNSNGIKMNRMHFKNRLNDNNRESRNNREKFNNTEFLNKDGPSRNSKPAGKTINLKELFVRKNTVFNNQEKKINNSNTKNKNNKQEYNNNDEYAKKISHIDNNLKNKEIQNLTNKEIKNFKNKEIQNLTNKEINNAINNKFNNLKNKQVKEKKKKTYIEKLNEVLIEKLSDYLKDNHQILIFVTSRKETENTRNLLQKEFPNKKFDIHHAGLPRKTRLSAEHNFKSKNTDVLVTTSTLAWGVNLPARCVFIKGTQFYDQDTGNFSNLGILDILQIFGRAGRPQFDSLGIAYLITENSQLNYYFNLLRNNTLIESKLLFWFVDILNAEIYLGNVNNLQDALNWMKSTFMFIRMMKVPLLYGFSKEEVSKGEIDKVLSEYVVLSVQLLLECNMISLVDSSINDPNIFSFNGEYNNFLNNKNDSCLNDKHDFCLNDKTDSFSNNTTKFFLNKESKSFLNKESKVLINDKNSSSEYNRNDSTPLFTKNDVETSDKNVKVYNISISNVKNVDNKNNLNKSNAKHGSNNTAYDKNINNSHVKNIFTENINNKVYKLTNLNTTIPLSFESTFMGRIASFYFISHESIKTWQSRLSFLFDLDSVLDLFFSSTEFKQIILRDEEVNTLKMYCTDLFVDYDDSTICKMKILFLLFQKGLPTYNSGLSCDQSFILKNLERMVPALKEIVIEYGMYYLFDILDEIDYSSSKLYNSKLNSKINNCHFGRDSNIDNLHCNNKNLHGNSNVSHSSNKNLYVKSNLSNNVNKLHSVNKKNKSNYKKEDDKQCKIKLSIINLNNFMFIQSKSKHYILEEDEIIFIGKNKHTFVNYRFGNKIKVRNGELEEKRINHLEMLYFYGIHFCDETSWTFFGYKSGCKHFIIEQSFDLSKNLNNELISTQNDLNLNDNANDEIIIINYKNLLNKDEINHKNNHKKYEKRVDKGNEKRNDNDNEKRNDKGNEKRNDNDNEKRNDKGNDKRNDKRNENENDNKNINNAGNLTNNDRKRIQYKLQALSPLLPEKQYRLLLNIKYNIKYIEIDNVSFEEKQKIITRKIFKNLSNKNTLIVTPDKMEMHRTKDDLNTLLCISKNESNLDFVKFGEIRQFNGILVSYFEKIKNKNFQDDCVVIFKGIGNKGIYAFFDILNIVEGRECIIYDSKNMIEYFRSL